MSRLNDSVHWSCSVFHGLPRVHMSYNRLLTSMVSIVPSPSPIGLNLGTLWTPSSALLHCLLLHTSEVSCPSLSCTLDLLLRLLIAINKFLQ